MKPKVVNRRAGNRYPLHVIKEEKESEECAVGHECSKYEKFKTLRPSNEILVNAKPIEMSKKFEFTFAEQSTTTKLGLLSYLFHLIIESNNIFRQIDAEMVKYSKETQNLPSEATSVDEARAFIKKSLSRNRQIYQQAKNELRIINEQKMNKLIGVENKENEKKSREASSSSIDLNSIQSELVTRIKDLKLKILTLTRSGEFDSCDFDARTLL
jgi:hypothetical protein